MFCILFLCLGSLAFVRENLARSGRRERSALSCRLESRAFGVEKKVRKRKPLVTSEMDAVCGNLVGGSM